MKEIILYCDDEEFFRNEFRRRHSNDFQIETVSNIKEIFNKLRQMKKLPDLLLLDLYYPKEIPNLSEAEKVAKEKIKSFNLNVRELKQFVDAAWEPVGIDALEEIRELYPEKKLPILIYTQGGLFAMDDKKIRTVENFGADWLLKDGDRISPTTEAIRIRRYIRRCQESRQLLKRDIKMALFGAILSFLLCYLFL